MREQYAAARKVAEDQKPTSAGPEVGGRSYAISRFFGPVPVHLVGCGLSLDRRAAGQRGAAAVNPHGLVQEFLNRSPAHLWGMVSNGLRLRILRDNQALSRMSPPSPLSALSRGPRSRWRRSGRMHFECKRLGQGKSAAAVMSVR